MNCVVPYVFDISGDARPELFVYWEGGTDQLTTTRGVRRRFHFTKFSSLYTYVRLLVLLVFTTSGRVQYTRHKSMNTVSTRNYYLESQCLKRNLCILNP